MAASITVHLQIFKCPQLPNFSTDSDNTGIKMHGLQSSSLKTYLSLGLRSPLNLGLSEPEFYDDLVYKFKKIMGRTDLSDQF